MGGSIPGLGSGLSGLGNILSGIGGATGGGSGGGGSAGGTNPNNPNQPNQQQYNFLTDPQVLAQFAMDQGRNPPQQQPPNVQPTFSDTNFFSPQQTMPFTPQQQGPQTTPQWQPGPQQGPSGTNLMGTNFFSPQQTMPYSGQQPPQQPQGPRGYYGGGEETQATPAPAPIEIPSEQPQGPAGYYGGGQQTQETPAPASTNIPATAPVGNAPTTGGTGGGGGGNIAKTAGDISKRIGRAAAGTQQPSYYPDIAGSARESGAGPPNAFTPQAGGPGGGNPLQAISNFLNQAFGGGLQGMTQQAGPAYGTNPPPTPPQAQATPGSATSNAPATAAAQAADAMAPGSAAAAIVAGAKGAQQAPQQQARPPLVLRNPSDPSQGYMVDPNYKAPGTTEPGSAPGGSPMPAATTGPPEGVKDFSAQSGLHTHGQMGQVRGFVVHHTGGNETTPQQLASELRQRGFGVQYFIDRAGQTWRMSPEGQVMWHTKNGGTGTRGHELNGLGNNNLEGVEIAARNDADVTPEQRQAAANLIFQRAQKFGFDPRTSVYGHGELNGDKERDEGMSTVSRIRNGTLTSSTKAYAGGQQAATGPVGQGVIPGSQQPAGTRPADVNYQPRDYQRALFQIEGGGNINAPRTGSNRGIAQFGREEERRFGITNRRDINQEARGVQKEATENTQHLQQAGVAADPANLYLLHQQGQAGGTALLQADANTPAYQAIRKFYGSDALAQRAIHGNIPSNNPLRNTPVDQITAGQFRDMWRTRFNEQMGQQSQVTQMPIQLAGDINPDIARMVEQRNRELESDRRRNAILAGRPTIEEGSNRGGSHLPNRRFHPTDIDEFIHRNAGSLVNAIPANRILSILRGAVQPTTVGRDEDVR